MRGDITVYIVWHDRRYCGEAFPKIQTENEKRFDELQFDADRKFERAEEYRLNYVVKHRDEIISHRRSTEEEINSFFLRKSSLNSCKAQKGGKR